MVTPQQIFELKQTLEKQSQELQQELLDIQKKQSETKKPEQLAELILQYEQTQKEISDRGQLFVFFSNPETTIASPYTKSALFSYIESAETLGPQMVDVLTDYFLQHVRDAIQSSEDNTVDSIQAEFKEYILPAKIIAERFDQIPELIDEMNRHCKLIDPQYDPATAGAVLKYAFEVSLDADIRLEPTVRAIREMQFAHLSPEDRAELLDRVAERLAVLRYEQAKRQNIAMDQAVQRLARREDDKR